MIGRNSKDKGQSTLGIYWGGGRRRQQKETGACPSQPVKLLTLCPQALHHVNWLRWQCLLGPRAPRCPPPAASGQTSYPCGSCYIDFQLRSRQHGIFSSPSEFTLKWCACFLGRKSHCVQLDIATYAGIGLMPSVCLSVNAFL